MALARAATLSRTDLVTMIRDEAGDPAVDAASNPISAAQRRFTDDDIDRKLRQYIKFLMTLVSAEGPVDSLLKTADLTLDSDGEVALPAPLALGSSTIYKVESVFSNIAVGMDYVSPLEMDRHDILHSTELPGRRRFTLIGGTDVTTSLVKLKVIPARVGASSVRVWYIGQPAIPGADSDMVPLSDRWEELLALGTACLLLARDDEATMQQFMRLEELKTVFRNNASRLQGPRRIRRRRRGIS